MGAMLGDGEWQNVKQPANTSEELSEAITTLTQAIAVLRTEEARLMMTAEATNAIMQLIAEDRDNLYAALEAQASYYITSHADGDEHIEAVPIEAIRKVFQKKTDNE